MASKNAKQDGETKKKRATNRTKSASTEENIGPQGHGRPTIRTEENRIKIISLVSEGFSLRQIAKMPGMPERSSIVMWLAEDDVFSTQYARAWQASADVDIEDMYEIVDNTSTDYEVDVDPDTGEVLGLKVNKEAILRSRLRWDHRRWIASKKAPKKYGDKLDIDFKGTSKVSQVTAEMTAEEAARVYAETIRGDKG